MFGVVDGLAVQEVHVDQNVDQIDLMALPEVALDHL